MKMIDDMKRKNTFYLGLVDISNQNETSNDEIRGFQSFCDRTMTVEYDNVVNRLITEIDVCPCNNRKQIFRVKNAVWDTGAVISAISNEYIEKMQLSPIDNGTVITSTGKSDCCYYLIDVYLTSEDCIKTVKVMGLPFRNHDADFIIGMDIISKGNLIIKNENGKTKIDFKYFKADK